MRFTIDFPPKELMPNYKNGRHWTSTRKVKKSAKDGAFYLTKSASNGTPFVKDEKYALKMIYMQSDKRHRDVDNLLAASKSQIDGIAQALGIDDRQFRPITIDVGYADTAHVIVELF